MPVTGGLNRDSEKKKEKNFGEGNSKAELEADSQF